MPVIFEEVLSKEISSGKLAPVYLFFGEDAFLKKHYADKISRKAYDGDPFFNLQKFEGDVDLQEVYDAVKQYPIMGDRKCVTLTDYDFEHASKSDLDKLCLLLSESEEGCVLVVRFDSVEFDAKRSSKAKKLIEAVEKSGGRAVQLDHRKVASLVKMLTDGAAKRGLRISEVTARYLIETAGDDINILKNELEKLCAFKQSGDIDKATVDLVCVKSAEASVYDYVKEIFACNVSAALSLLDDMFFMRLEPMIILHTAASAYVDIFRASAAAKSGVPISAAAKDFGYKNKAFLLDRAAQNLKKLDSNKIELSFNALLEADRALKSFGSDPRTELEKLTIRLIYIIVKGEAVD